MKKYIFSLFIVILFSQLSMASFEDANIGARQSGMADAYTAIVDDPYALFYNPGGLINVTHVELSSMYSQLYYGLDDGSNLSDQSFAFVLPIDKINGIGLGWYGKNFSGLYREDTFVIGYARKFFDILSSGINLKMRTKKYSSNEWTQINPVLSSKKTVSKLSLDLGFLINLKNNFLGLSVQDINQPDVGLFNSAILPTTMRLGYFRNLTQNLKAGTDFIYRAKDYEVTIGFENKLKNRFKGFMLRGGFGTGNDEYKNLSFGLGYLFNKSPELQIDYAFNYPLSGIEGTAGSHLFSVDIKFGENKHLAFQERKSIRQREEKERQDLLKTEKEFNKALNLYTNNKLIQAYENFESILNGKVQNAYKIIGKSKKYRKTILKKMKKSIARGEQSPDYFYAQGFSHYTKKEYSNTLSEWNKITVLNPHFQEVKNYIDKIQKILGDIKKDAAAITESDEEKIDDFYKQGIIKYINGDLPGAIKIWEEIMTINPNNELVLNSLIKARKELENDGLKKK